MAGTLAAATICGLVLLAPAELPINLNKPDSPAVPVERMNDIRYDATVAAVEEVMPSVVNVATSRLVEYHDFYDELRRRFYGLPRNEPRTQEKLNSLGSGVIIDEDGYILTNLHVLRRASRIQVKLSDGRVYDADVVVFTDKSDVALLKIRSQPGEKFKAIKFAPDDDLLLGETVIALGNPFGLGGSVSRGILSSKNRRPATGNEPLNVADWLQTDAAINPGNSGGPLINLRGELIGINVAVYEQGQGIGFAIPVREVAKALSQFFSPEIANSKWFGAWLKGGVTPPTISVVQPGSPAEKAGLKPGMQITRVNGHPVRSLVGFSEHIVSDAEEKEDTVKLGIVDAGKTRTVKVEMEKFENLVKRQTGLTVQELTRQAADRMGLAGRRGVLIQSVAKGSPADKAELKPGLLITDFDNDKVDELRDLAFALINKGQVTSANVTVLTVESVGGPYVRLVQDTKHLELLKP